MNHTGVNSFRLSQSVKDEANNILDATEIGTDEEFVVCTTEVLSQHEFESRGYCRVPCTVGKAYIKQYIPRNHRKIYRLAYKTELDANGNPRPPFYRVIKLESRLQYLHPSGEPLYTFTIDSTTNRVTLDNGNSVCTMPLSDVTDTAIDAIGYRGGSPRANYTYVAPPPMWGNSGDIGYASAYTGYMARGTTGEWNLR